MKNRLILSFSLILSLFLCIAVGFTSMPKLEETIVKNTNKTNIGEPANEATNEMIVADENLSTIEALTTEDKAVKEEIAKHSKTAIDFRNEKQECFEGKEYSLMFSKMGSTTSNSFSSYITYINDVGDEFSYDLDTGELKMVYFYSLENEKTNESIDINDAKAIADDFASKQCDMSTYILDDKEERDNGYMFTYCKYIYNYKTNDRIRVLIGFDGNIVWAAIRVYPIDENVFSVDKIWFDLQIEKMKNSNQNIVIEKTTVERDRHDNKVYFNIQYKEVDNDGNVLSKNVNAIEIN